jgi:hypothetical protein
MIHRISEEIAYRLNENLSWVDTCVGIVKPITYVSNGESKVIPVYFNTKRDLCSGADYLTIIPDSSKVSVAYMELNEDPEITDINDRWVRFSSNVDLIFWFNYQKINVGMIDSDMLIANAIDSIPDYLPNSEYIGVSIDVDGISTDAERIFRKYTYNDGTMFTMYPYDFFSIKLKIQYSIMSNCSIVRSSIDECNMKPVVITIGKDKVEVPFGVIKQ